MRTKIAGIALATTVALGGGVALAQPAFAQDEESPDRIERKQERLDALVAEGVITQEDADARLERIAERQAAREERATALAETFGTTVEDLRTSLRAGDSLADIAAEAGVDVQVIIDQLVAAATERIEGAVAEGQISQEDADEKLAEVEDKITARVNGERSGRGHHRHRGGPRSAAQPA